MLGQHSVTKSKDIQLNLSSATSAVLHKKPKQYPTETFMTDLCC